MRKISLVTFLSVIFLANFAYSQEKEIICAEDNCVPNFIPEEQFEKVYFSSIDGGESNIEPLKVDSEINTSPRDLRLSLNQNDSSTNVTANINLSPKTDEFDSANLIFLTDFLKSLNLNLNGYQGSFGKPASQICAENYVNGKYGAIAREEFNAKRISDQNIPSNRCIYSDVDYLQKNEFECDEGYQEIASDNPSITVRRLKGKVKCLGVGFQDLCLSKSVEVSCVWRLKYLDPPELAGQFSTNSNEEEVKKFVISEQEYLEKKKRGLIPYLCNTLTKRPEDEEPLEKLRNGGFYQNADNWALSNNAKWVNSKVKLDDGPVINMTYPVRPGDGLRMQVYTGKFSRLRKETITPNINYYNSDDGNRLERDTGMYSRFSIRFSGYVRPKFSETYKFYAWSDDGVRVWVNNKLIIDRWHNQSPNWGSPGSIFLEKDKLYSIRVDYYERKGRNRIALDWSSKSQGRQRVPKSSLYSVFQKDFLSLNKTWTDEIALNLTTHFNQSSEINLNYEYLIYNTSLVKCRTRNRQLLCKFYIPAHQSATNKTLSDVLKVKIYDNFGNSNIYDIQLNYKVYDTNISSDSNYYHSWSGINSSEACSGDVAESSVKLRLLSGYNNRTDYIREQNYTYCYQGSCSSSWEGAIKPRYPQFTNAYGSSNIRNFRCGSSGRRSSYIGGGSFSFNYTYYRYASTVYGRWFEGYVSIERESLPTVERIVSTEESKKYRLTASYFEPSEERASSKMKLIVKDDVTNVTLKELIYDPIYNQETNFIDFAFITPSYRTKFIFQALEADPENYSSSIYLDNVSLKEVSLNAGPSIPPTEPLTANVEGESGNGYFALYGEPSYERTSPGYDGQSLELLEGSTWKIQYTGINQTCPVFSEKIATNYLASHIGYDDNDDQCDDVQLAQDPENVLAWSNIGFERSAEFGTETLGCSTASCPVSSTIQNLSKNLDSISTTSGINGTNQGRGIIMSYDMENINYTAKVGVAGKAGSNDLPIISSAKACVKIQDFNTEGPESEYAMNPVVDFRLYNWQALKVEESQDLGVNPKDNGNRVYIYKKMDSSSRYFLMKEML